MGVGNAHQLEQALHAAVFTPAPVQGIEADVRLDAEQPVGEIAAGVDARDLVSSRFQRVRTRLAGVEAHLALSGQPAHENRDVIEAA
jgi:hypothetical protein